MLKITSPEALDSVIAECVRRKIAHTAATAEMEAEIATVQKRHQKRMTAIADEIAELETQISQYCQANRKELFPEKKSRETPLAVVGFEITPWRVERSSAKLTWGKIVERLEKLVWGEAYIRYAEPKIDKDALLRDRELLTPEQLTAAGVRFDRDEQFYLRPKPETAQE